jgi:CheY-like chemotaxis protein
MALEKRINRQSLARTILKASGPAAVGKASRIQPRLRTIDVRVPGISGHEVTVQSKKTPATQDTPAIRNTGWTTAGNVEE